MNRWSYCATKQRLFRSERSWSDVEHPAGGRPFVVLLSLSQASSRSAVVLPLGSNPARWLPLALTPLFR